MKWAGLLLFIFVGFGFIHALRTNPRTALFAAFLFGFLPFVMTPWHLIVAPYSISGWPGYVKGWEVGLIDAIAVACLIAVPRARSGLPFKYVFLLYITATLVSAILAPNFKIALSYPLQLARIFLVFAAVARLNSSPHNLKATLQGLFVGLAYQAAIAIWAKLGGAIQTGGSFGHQNALGFVSHLVFIPAFGLLLSGLWTRWAIVGLISGAIVVTLTVSRATIGFAAVGLIITYCLSATSQWSTRKGVVALVSLALIGISIPIINSTFEQRFAVKGGSYTNVDEEREAFKRAAKMMIADYPFGVGANHYVVVANTQGYSSRAGVVWNSGSRSTNVHNSYLLVQAEAGFLGLFAIILLLSTSVMTTLRYALKYRGSSQSDLLFGIVGALCAVILHSFYEWLLVTHQAQYVLAIALGMAAGLIRQLRSVGDGRNQKLLRREGKENVFLPPTEDVVLPSQKSTVA